VFRRKKQGEKKKNSNSAKSQIEGSEKVGHILLWMTSRRWSFVNGWQGVERDMGEIKFAEILVLREKKTGRGVGKIQEEKEGGLRAAC